MAAKHSSRLPPLTRCNTAARSTKTAIAASWSRGDLLGTDTLNTQRSHQPDKGSLTNPCSTGAPLLFPRRTHRDHQPVIITQGHRLLGPTTIRRHAPSLPTATQRHHRQHRPVATSPSGAASTGSTENHSKHR
jgi:hypothetical protein